MQTITTATDNNNNNNKVSTTTYRYEFSKSFCEELEGFARIHKYDDRKVFKEAWKTWSEENAEWIERECNVLREAGYEGDALDKMFKSTRYYFRKKDVVEKEKTPRKTYTKVEAGLLKEMDSFIKDHMEIKPHECYMNFCEKFGEELAAYMRELGEEKIKKTFKNRRSIMQKSKTNQEQKEEEQEQLV